MCQSAGVGARLRSQKLQQKAERKKMKDVQCVQVSEGRSVLSDKARVG
jgi:hypothetical protein